jgi:hypothetical protein
MDLVINEWFAEYCRVEETNEHKQQLKNFLEKFHNTKYVLYVRRPSDFLGKIHRYAKQYQSHRDTYSISIITYFIKTILLDSKRCVFVDEECILEEIVLEKLNEGNYSSDTYLFEAASKTKDKLIITTDDKLCRQMHGIADYQVINLSDFLQRY